MAILIQVNAEQTVIWKDEPSGTVIWKSSSAVVWKDQDNIESNTLYLSLYGEALDHYWNAYISGFTAPQFQLAKDFGGFEEMGFGSIEFSPDAFTGNWPPAKQCTITIEYTNSTEDAAVEIFTGDIYLERFTTDSVSYKINDKKYTQNLLDVGVDYNGDTVPYPKGFGTVSYVEPLRLADIGIYPTYHLASLATTNNAKAIISFSSFATGTKTKVVTEVAHDWSNGNSVTIDGTINFAGAHTIESAVGSTFAIPVAFPTDNSENLPIHANAHLSGAFTVYDDGVPIQENVLFLSDGTFSLSASPVGTVTMSGTASETDLEEVMSWGRLRLNMASLATTYARAVSPEVSYWADSQQPLIDFMSDVCAFFTHYFFIKGSRLTLGDMLLDNGSETLDEYDYFDVSYSAMNATSQVKASWSTWLGVEEKVDEIRSAKYVKEFKNSIVASLYTISSGTTDGTELKKLDDSGATFITDGVLVGHVAQNLTDNTSSVILAVTETALELVDDIFVSGESYVVGPSFPYGKEVVVEPYHNAKSNVSAALQNILLVLSRDYVEITIPISDTLPEPGKKLTFSDTQTVEDTNSWIRARTLSYKFESEEVTIGGEGVIA